MWVSQPEMKLVTFSFYFMAIVRLSFMYFYPEYEYENTEDECNKYYRNVKGATCDCLNSEYNDYYDLECMDFHETVNITSDFKYFELRFKDCRLPILRDNTFSGFFIRRLYIINCSLTHLEKHAFANVYELELLDLSGNFLTNFNASILKAAKKLSSLRLSRNPFKIMNIRTFLDEIPDLQELHLVAANVFHIPKMTNAGNNLEVLELTHNKIDPSDIPNLFTLPRLKYLDLGSNGLSTVTFKGLERMKRLKKLLLQENFFKEVPEIKSISLEKLDLSDNAITTPPHFKLSHMPMLSQLDLYGNNITVLNETSFCGLKNVKKHLVILLSGNYIKKIEPCAFRNFHSDVLVHILDSTNDTELECGCGLAMMIFDKVLAKKVYCQLHINDSYSVTFNSNAEEVLNYCHHLEMIQCENTCDAFGFLLPENVSIKSSSSMPEVTFALFVVSVMFLLRK